ncbi:flippase [Shouchella lehensis]|uniref:Capsular polysaccharide biosynthesis protein CapF n=1 Tax=Shouchella lehensis G1 TaxID=1246626 RepID=A0A060M119_9BACI|nr:flippase [Shouchella lehensis]AIC96097.1 Capsular polysaccharide biosynthesis protein CapF [Shouchella lehensis G1]
MIKELFSKLVKNKKHLFNAFLAVAVKGSGAVMSFLTTILIARLLGAEGNGVFFIALSIMTFSSVISRLGMDNALLKYSALSHTDNNTSWLKGVIKQSFLTVLIVGALITLLLQIISPLLGGIFNDSSLIIPLQLMAFAIIPFSIFNLNSELLKSMGKPKVALAIQSPALHLIFLLTLILFSQNISPYRVVLLYVIATFVVLIISIIVVKKNLPLDYNKVEPENDYRSFMRTALPLLWVNALNVLISTTDIFMLGFWTSTDDVGVYSAVMRVVLFSSMILVSINSIVAPKFATLWDKKEYKKLEKFSSDVTIGMTGLSFIILLPFLLFPTVIMSFFGESFATGDKPLMIMAIGQFFVLATGPVGYLLMMSGHEKFYRNNVIISAVLNVLLNLTLIPFLGINGAALSTSISLIVKNILAVLYVRKKISIKLFKIF